MDFRASSTSMTSIKQISRVRVTHTHAPTLEISWQFICHFIAFCCHRNYFAFSSFNWILWNENRKTMQREEKQLEALLDAVLNRLNDLKHSIGAMIHKIETEYETIYWPTFLDNFALISSHVSLLSPTIVQKRKRINWPNVSHIAVDGFVENFGTWTWTSTSKSYRVAVASVTGTRRNATPIDWRTNSGICARYGAGLFTHKTWTDGRGTNASTRTKGKEKRFFKCGELYLAIWYFSFFLQANNLLAETAIKQVSQFTKVISHIYEMVNKARDEWDVESSARSGVQQTSSLSDTHALVSAVGMGKGLVGNMNVPGGPMSGGMMVPPAIRPTVPAAGGAAGKAPSAVKTNIKSANQIHPYIR